jgi:ABC-2 type transport system ATP-binding protein
VFHVTSLVKRYGDLRAVDGVSFEVRAGEIYGLLGPNGAGKTTTMSMLSGLLRPDDGDIRFDGIDLAAEPIRVKAQLGVVPQETALYETLTARENLRFWGGLYGLAGGTLASAVDRTLEYVGLTARAGEPVEKYSGGMKRRLNLALGLVHGPRAILLDEPTVGIDPQARANVLDVVREVARQGTTIVYTTHYLEEAESLCDRIGIMDHGRILAEGTLDELKRQAGEAELITVRGVFDATEVGARLEAEHRVKVIGSEEGKLVLAMPDGGSGSAGLLSALFGGDLRIDDVSIQPPSLNALFLKMTGRELRD